MQEIMIKTETIKLDQFLKWANLVSSGGEAKILIQGGHVLVNGEVEERRSHILSDGDVVKLSGGEESYRVTTK